MSSPGGDGPSRPSGAELAASAVLGASESMPEGTPVCRGYDFDRGLDYDALLGSYLHSGFQATNLGLAVEQINSMLKDKMGPVELPEGSDSHFDYPRRRPKTGCTIFLGFTSNMISSGLRESIRFLVQHKLVDVLVTSAGGVEEDLIKCLAPTFMGDFALKGADLRKRGLNRIGNLIVPNNNYCAFEDWVIPRLDAMLAEQKADPELCWTPSSMVRRLGLEIADESSVCYWAAKNDIPIFCPGLTDGSLGDMLYFHSYRNPGLKLDIIADIRHLNDTAVRSVKSGMVILGGGLVKHHICNANLMRNGADYAVFVNTGQEFDGSDSGAKPDEAVSWGKIRLDARPVKLSADATLVFPLIVAQTFYKAHRARLDESSAEEAK